MILAVISAKAVAKRKPEKNSGLNGIRTHDLCDTGAVLYQLSFQAFGISDSGIFFFFFFFAGGGGGWGVGGATLSSKPRPWKFRRKYIIFWYLFSDPASKIRTHFQTLFLEFKPVFQLSLQDD